jgi:hypothetical protein
LRQVAGIENRDKEKREKRKEKGAIFRRVLANGQGVGKDASAAKLIDSWSSDVPGYRSLLFIAELIRVLQFSYRFDKRKSRRSSRGYFEARNSSWKGRRPSRKR